MYKTLSVYDSKIVNLLFNRVIWKVKIAFGRDGKTNIWRGMQHSLATLPAFAFQRTKYGHRTWSSQTSKFSVYCYNLIVV